MIKKRLSDFKELKEYVDFIRIERRFNNKMGSIKEEALNYVPKNVKNIADLEKVNLEEFEVFEKEGTTEDGAPYKFKYIIIDDEEYRIPNSVLDGIKTLITNNNDISFVKVIKSGEGFKTKYQVIPA